VLPPKGKREVLSTLSPHVLALQPATNMIMLLAQDAIEKLMLALV
jgi:hypothetical protein